jgi:hypothetical protein
MFFTIFFFFLLYICVSLFYGMGGKYMYIYIYIELYVVNKFQMKDKSIFTYIISVFDMYMFFRLSPCIQYIYYVYIGVSFAVLLFKQCICMSNDRLGPTYQSCPSLLIKMRFFLMKKQFLMTS